MVARGGDLSDLSAQLSGQQRRRDRRPSGHRRTAALRRELGVDAVWISPFFTSPMLDFGYDVSDYRDVDPMFGSLGDFDALISTAHALGLKVMIDLVLSHTSNQHPWFVESRTGRDNSRHDWYVWADAKPDGTRPTTGCRSSAARPGNGTASGCSTTCTTSWPSSRT
jgi:glycosidase